MAIKNFKCRERTDYLVIHCTGTEDDGAREIRRKHLEQGYLDIGYAFVIRRNGMIETGRPHSAPSAFPPKDSLTICCVGNEEISDEQAISLRSLIMELADEYPFAKIYPNCRITNYDFTKEQETNDPG